MLGMPAAIFPQGSNPAPQAAEPQAAEPQDPPQQAALHKQTLLGLPPASAVGKSTMLGIAPAQPAPAPDQAAAAAGPSSFASAAAARPAVFSDKRTMLGVAMPGIAPVNPGMAPAGASAGPVGSHKRTMLGVAMPGIAPINPGVAQPSSAAPPSSTPPGGAAQQPSTPDWSHGAQATSAPTTRPPTRRSWLPWFLVATAVVVLMGGVALWLLLKPSTPISARVQATERGEEQLELSCLTCPDGSQIKLKSRPDTGTSFSAGRASLALTSSLKVGDNTLELELTRPGARPEQVELSIPVDYRVHVDLTALDATPPKLALAVEARPGSKVQIEDEPLELDASGKGTWTQDVSSLLVGEAKSVERLERELTYKITPPGGDAQTGTAKLRIGIAPLVVEAPLSKLTVDKARFLLSGTTQPDVEVSVSGRAIKRGADGKFSQVMSVSTLGETSVFVKASKQGYAPRLVPIRVKRVEDLDQARVEFTKQDLKSYRDVSAALGKSAGAAVAWSGRVTDLRTADGRTVILLDVSGQCAAAPCLARVVYAGESRPKPGAKVTIYGEMTRAVAGPRSGQQVPEIHAEFLIEGGT